MRAIAWSLWGVALACFVGSWMLGDRRLVAAGAATMVVYIGLAAKAHRVT